MADNPKPGKYFNHGPNRFGENVGDVDLVCQVGSSKSISTLLQRVGRSGHGINRTPKGRLFPTTLEELVECVALLDVPLFNTHWRWVCNISLAVQRYQGGKRLAPQIQRSNAEDLAAQVFPDQLACLEYIVAESIKKTQTIKCLESESIGLQAPAALAASWTMTLPVDAGTNGYILSTDGTGVTSWVAQ